MPWYARLRNLFREQQLSRELDNELEFHISERAADLRAEGVPEEQAWREARLRLGNYSLQKERTRDMNIAGWLEAALANFSFGLRQLRLSPGFTAVAVGSLALGIGANSAIFQLVDAVRLRGLPVRDPWQLAAVDTGPQFFTAGWYQSRNTAFTFRQMEVLQRKQQAFSDMLTFGSNRFNLSTGGKSRFASGLYVSPNFLHVLGVSPVVGRDFSAAESTASCASPGVLLDYAFWQREFGGDLKALGRTVSLDGHRFPVIGVTPASFFGVEPGVRFDVALPLCAENLFAKDGKGRMYNAMAYWLTAIGRLKPGWTAERASSHLRDLSPALFRESLPAEYRPKEADAYKKNKLRAASASAGVSSLRREYEDPLFVLMGITGLVLLIACANLANLLLARASVREREIAVRQALGASRLRLIGQLFCESLLLAVMGGVLGALLAQVLSRSLVAFLNSPDNPVTLAVGVDWRSFGFIAALALLTCLLFGLVPAIRASGAAPAEAMRGGRTSTANRERNGLRRALVVCQVALSLVLLVGALLFTRSLQKLVATAVGFDSQNVLAATVTASGPAFEDQSLENQQRRQSLFRETQARLDGIPGVTSSAAVWFTPFSGSGWNGSVHSDSDSAASGGKEGWFNRTGPKYFSTMGTPLLSGRDFNRGDIRNAPKVAIVNQSFGKRFFGGRNPVGRSFRVEEGAGKPDSVYQIAGLVGDTKYNTFREKARSIAFLPIDQDPETGDSRTFVIRARGSLDQVAAGFQRQLADLNSNLLVEFKVLDVQIRRSVVREQLMANLSVAFGVLAACLSTLGLYGVMSYMVARRRVEIGVRVALGASRASVLALVLKDAATMLAIGLGIGIAAAIFLSRYAESLLFGLKANDPVILVLGSVLLATTAAVATFIPARKAAQLEPSIALREE